MQTSKHMNNKEIAELLRNVAAAHQLSNETKFKFQIIAYNRAADSVDHATSELKDLWDDGKLDSIPGIGPSIASHLDEIFITGKSKHFEEITKGIDPRVFDLMELPGIGIKTALRLVAQGKPFEINAKLKEVERLRSKDKRLLLPYAEKVASEVMEWILSSTYVEKAGVLGSLRRRVATIGDVDILATPKNSNDKKVNDKLIEHFTRYPKLQKIIEQGEHTAAILLPNNVQVDLLVIDKGSYGSALQHFTGSKNHNIALREYAKKKGFSLSEYGIKNINSKKENAKLKTFSEEKDFYNFLGLECIPPELREDMGEIIISKNKKLPNLVELSDIKSDLQIHSSFDIETSHDLGMSSMEEIINKASSLGYEYLAFTEHNPSRSKHTDNEIVEILNIKRETIEIINYSLQKGGNNRVRRVFNSLEIDIPSAGGVNIPDIAFDYLDFALVSIHSSFSQTKTEQTKRVLKALDHPKVKILAHPTGRKLNEREGVDLDWPEIFEFCVKNNKIIEINASPSRLDLPDLLVHDAIRAGVKLSLGTDSHHSDHMDNMKYGIDVARRGWCEKKDIINCLTLESFQEMIQ